MAAHAQNRRVGQLRGHGCGIAGMVRPRTVAGFASYTSVLALALRLGYIGVAGLADRVPGELDRSGADVIHGSGAKMPVLAEIRWDDHLADE